MGRKDLEEAGAYKDVSGVVETAVQAKLARKAAQLEPLISIKGRWGRWRKILKKKK